ncbi:MAG TPA: RnfABCDGE type electron transport complex subunit B [Clostridia bacterium]|nr:RnfABCDGE type electron transport complex subunit B [Clostridia bacterium]
MNDILLAVLIISAIGLIAGLGLAIASKVMAVPVDEKEEELTQALPGANCGACGFSGCSGYALALSQGETTNTALCNPGGNELSREIAKILSLEAGEVKPSAAVVLCQGNSHNATKKLDYKGVMSCKMATQLFGGPKDCVYGCIGYGDCVEACPYDAIHICDGVARVNPLYCRACKICVEICPKNLIELLPLHEVKAAVLCANKDRGAQTRKQCMTGCIGCMKCAKVCPTGAITVKDFCAHVDYDKCTGCGKCVEVCPMNCINLIDLDKIVRTSEKSS